MGFTIKRVLRRVLRRGSEKGVSRRCLERPPVEYAPLGVRPKRACQQVLRKRVSNTRKNPRAHKNKIGTSTPPPSKKLRTPPPPLKGGILWAWGLSSRKTQKIPGGHKIGAAISGPRIAGGTFYGHEAFTESNYYSVMIGVVLSWKPRKFRLQLQFFSLCCVGITPHFSIITSIF